MSSITIVLPERSEDELSDFLRALTKAICEAHPELESGYGLGGEFGYGENFENDIFVMRRQYWGECDCGWSEKEWAWHEKTQGKPDYDEHWKVFLKDNPGHSPQCALELPNFLHKRTGFEVRWYKWIGRDNEIKNPPTDIAAVIAECIQSLTINVDGQT